MDIPVYSLCLVLVLCVTQISIVNSKTCKKHHDCGCILDGSGLIDLTPIGTTDGTALFQDYPSSLDGYLYSYNPCGKFTEVTCTDVAACQYDPSYYAFYDIGVPSSVTFDYDGQNVKALYTSQDGVRQTTVTLVCDPVQTSPLLTVAGETTTTQYSFTLTASAACPVSYSTGLSAGSVLLIVFFSLAAGYLLFGGAYMKVKEGANGKDIIPNITFWSTLPGLIKDGCALVMGVICRKRSVYVSM
ncbi:hypothetical protein ACF0H5_018928 [Mactra antiquata]